MQQYRRVHKPANLGGRLNRYNLCFCLPDFDLRGWIFYHDINTLKLLTETLYIFLDQKALKQDLNSVENACQLLQQIVTTESEQ